MVTTSTKASGATYEKRSPSMSGGKNCDAATSRKYRLKKYENCSNSTCVASGATGCGKRRAERAKDAVEAWAAALRAAPLGVSAGRSTTGGAGARAHTGAHRSTREHTGAHLGQEAEGGVLGVHQPVRREAVGRRPRCVEANVPRLGLLLAAEQPAAQAAAPTTALAAIGEEAVGLGLHLTSELHLPSELLVRWVLEGVVWAGRLEAGHGDERASAPLYAR
eukprot:scaffold24017_cov82-Phaeocystis_antarctica.AAC.7